MKVLLAVDGSAHSDAAIDELARHVWPPGTQVLVLTVVHASAPIFPDPALVLTAAHFQQIQVSRDHAPDVVARASTQLRRWAPHLRVSTKVDEGIPKDVIVEAARAWDADVIVVGSHGHGRVRNILLGSVAHGVVTDAPCSVLVARTRQPMAA